MFSLHTLIDLLNVTALKPISGTLVHMTVYVVSTGGTIASTADVSGALVPTLSADELVARSETTRDVQTREIASLDSSSMGLADIDRLRALTSTLPVSYTHLTLPTKSDECRSRWSPYH